MLKSQILEKLSKKHTNLNQEDIEILFNIFIKKISESLRNGQNIEIRGFGTLSRKVNKEKFVRNPKTNEKLFKIGKILHKKINSAISINNKDGI